MSRRWTRTRSLSLPRGRGETSEVWTLLDGDMTVASYPLQVTLGKPFDVLRMKGQSPDLIRNWTAQVQKAVAELYAPTTPRRRVAHCPCCSAPIDGTEEFCRIFGVAYHRCPSCSHVFVKDQPAPDVLTRMFAENDDYAQDYVSKESLEQRMREIVQPKLDWVRATYHRHYGWEPESAVDVGAGGGHFVACCGQAGLKAEGYEINKAAVRFAKTTLGVELTREDFLAARRDGPGKDIATCWGLLEYTPEPSKFVAAARRCLAEERGMLIVEVPRADAFGSAVQTQFPDAVWRHLAPASHVNIFSDASLATLLHRNGLRPIAAWYFGMDFYELLTQFAADLDDQRLTDRLGHLVAPMQAWLDCAEFVDDLIVAAVPG